jgi:FkbM family methyltransferase
MLKTKLQKLFQRCGLYYRLKESLLYDVYWWVVDRKILDKRKSEVAFYRTTLKGFRRGDLILDIGANHGQKTDVFLRLGARVVAIEPDEFNQDVLRQKFLYHRFIKKPVIIVGKAVSDRRSHETMWIDAPGSAKNTLSKKWVETLRADVERFGTRLDFARKLEVETVPLEDLFVELGIPFYVKIDVEGHEPSVLRGLRNPVRYLSFEVNLPEFKREGFDCIELLGKFGPAGRFNYATDGRMRMVLENWLPLHEFTKIFENCRENCIEIFWSTVE